MKRVRLLPLLQAIMLSAWAATAVAQAADESVIVFSRVYAAQGREAEVESRLVRLVAHVKDQVPGITYLYYRSAKDPTLFLTYEVFPDKATAAKVVREVVPGFAKVAGPSPAGLYAKPAEFEIVRPLSVP